MQAHVDEIARNVANGAHAVLIMDRAAWHATSKLDTSKNHFFVGIFSIIMADDWFYGGLVSIVSAKLGDMPPLAASLAHAAAYFPDSQTKRRML